MPRKTLTTVFVRSVMQLRQIADNVPMVDSVLLSDRVSSSVLAVASAKRLGRNNPHIVNMSVAPVTRATSAFLLCREDFTIVYVSDLLQVLLQLPEQRVGGQRRNIFNLLGSSAILDAASVETVLGPLRQSGLFSATFYLKTEAGEQTLDVRVKPAGDDQWMLGFEDVRADQERRAELLALTLTDPLVGTNNRRCYQQTVKSSLADNIPGAVLLLDLDCFNTVNQTLGHAVGDQLLRKVGERLRTVVSSDDLLARLGGDAFAVWSYSVNKAALERLSANIVDLLGRPFFIGGQQVNIGASVGIAYATEDYMTYERLMKSADLALYAAKEAGRGCVRCFDPTMETAANDRRKLELELQEALTLHQFEVRYQPRIDVESGSLVGLEAVLRWHHPELGLLEPESFIHLAEEIGLTSAIGKWMLMTACNDAAALVDVPSTSLRLTHAQFTDRESLVDVVKQALGASGMPPELLELQINEATLLHREEHVLQTLHKLRALGVSLGMDEFGTGSASLSRLVSFPFDRVRLATSLVSDASPTHHAIVHAVARLGSNLGMKTLIDGSLSLEQLACIRGEGGSPVQACRLDPALPPDRLPDLVRHAVKPLQR